MILIFLAALSGRGIRFVKYTRGVTSGLK